jgi:hypothetical protein
MSRPTHTRRPASVQVPDHCEEDRHSAVYPCLPATARFLINIHTFLILMLLWEVSGQAPPAISLLLLLQVGTAVCQHPQPPCQPKVSGVVLLSQNTTLGKHTGLLHVSLTLHVSPMPHPTTLHTDGKADASNGGGAATEEVDFAKVSIAEAFDLLNVRTRARALQQPSASATDRSSHHVHACLCT